MKVHAVQNFQSIASCAKQRKVEKINLLLVNTLYEPGILIFSNILIAVEQSNKRQNKNNG